MVSRRCPIDSWFLVSWQLNQNRQPPLPGNRWTIDELIHSANGNKKRYLYILSFDEQYIIVYLSVAPNALLCLLNHDGRNRIHGHKPCLWLFLMPVLFSLMGSVFAADWKAPVPMNRH